MKKLLFLIALISISSQAFAQRAECDRLAGSPTDPQMQAPGVSYDKLNAPLAIIACRKAVTDEPGSGRLWFEYGRALEKGNQLPDAILAYQEGVKFNHPVALNNLGELYRDGKGVPRDMQRAEQYFRRSAELNSVEGKSNLLALQKNMPQSSAPAPQPSRAGTSSIECQVRPGVTAYLYTDKELTKLGKKFQTATSSGPFSYMQIDKGMTQIYKGVQVMFGNGFNALNDGYQGYVASYWLDASQWVCRGSDKPFMGNQSWRL